MKKDLKIKKLTKEDFCKHIRSYTKSYANYLDPNCFICLICGHEIDCILAERKFLEKNERNEY